MFDCGCHDKDTSDAPNMAFFVHSPKKPTTTQKNSGGFKNLFPTLLHFLKESLLTNSPWGDIFQGKICYLGNAMGKTSKKLKRKYNIKFENPAIKLLMVNLTIYRAKKILLKFDGCNSVTGKVYNCVPHGTFFPLCLREKFQTKVLKRDASLISLLTKPNMRMIWTAKYVWHTEYAFIKSLAL